MTGWNLPPGCTDRMVDEAAGGYDEPKYDGEEEDFPPHDDDPAWRLYAGPFVSLDAALAATRSLNEYSLRQRSFFRGWKFGIWPDPATTTKWIIKRRRR